MVPGLWKPGGQSSEVGELGPRNILPTEPFTSAPMINRHIRHALYSVFHKDCRA